MTDILEQWNTKTAGGSDKLEIADFELIQDNIHLMKNNYSALEIVDLIGRITNNRSSSGPIAGTVDVINFLATTSGSAVGKDEDGFYSNPGEVWKIFGPSLSVGGGSGSIQHELRLIRDGATLEILDFSTTGGSLRPTTEEGFIGGEIYVSYPAYLVYEATGTFTNSGLALGVVRVR